MWQKVSARLKKKIKEIRQEKNLNFANSDEKRKINAQKQEKKMGIDFVLGITQKNVTYMKHFFFCVKKYLYFVGMLIVTPLKIRYVRK